MLLLTYWFVFLTDFYSFIWNWFEANFYLFTFKFILSFLILLSSLAFLSFVLSMWCWLRFIRKLDDSTREKERRAELGCWDEIFERMHFSISMIDSSEIKARTWESEWLKRERESAWINVVFYVVLFVLHVHFLLSLFCTLEHLYMYMYIYLFNWDCMYLLKWQSIDMMHDKRQKKRLQTDDLFLFYLFGYSILLYRFYYSLFIVYWTICNNFVFFVFLFVVTISLPFQVVP